MVEAMVEKGMQVADRHAPDPSQATHPATPTLVGVVNLTEDSFSDGGRYLDPEIAAARALDLVSEGAGTIDLGAASSRPGAAVVTPEAEIRRLAPVVERLADAGVPISIDSFAPDTQRWAMARGVAFLNDIQGFPHAELHAELARSTCRLVVMHSVQRAGPATRVATDREAVLRGMAEFFAERLGALQRAGVARERLIVDPGMGFFLGTDPEVSLEVLRRLGALRRSLGLPVWIGVSRKSFLGQITGRPIAGRGAATLAAELFAARQGADFLRTHDVGALRDALLVERALEA